VQPDLLVKGGDYTQDRVVGADFVEDRGGEVVILPYREQCSTSALIDRIRGGTGEESG
jgi:D-beta-D-heptose 7-phosphate kinase/D-beta-D-heptose 1-phosphate adenosyltransferase